METQKESLNILGTFFEVISVQFSHTVVTPWTAARQASLSIANSWSLLKLMSVELVMPSNHLIVPVKLTTTIEEEKRKKNPKESTEQVKK